MSWPFWGVIALYLFHVTCNALWLREDTYPLIWDHGHHYMKSLRSYFYLSHAYLPMIDAAPFEKLMANVGSQPSFLSMLLCFLLLPLSLLVSLISQFGSGSKHPFLVYFVTAPFYFLFGNEPDAAIWIEGTLFLGILFFSAYGLGRRLGGPALGLLTAFVLSMYPVIYGQGRGFRLDVPLTAMVTLSIYSMVRSENFRHRGFSRLFGLSVGLGMLTQEMFFLFVVGPLVYLLWNLFSRHRLRESVVLKERLAHLKQAGWIALSVMALWYVPYSFSLVGRAYDYLNLYLRGGSTEAMGLVKTTSSGLIAYLSYLPDFQISVFFVVLFLAALPLFLLRSPAESKPILLAWIIVPYAFFALFPIKETRYTMPFLPALALITALGWGEIRHEGIKTALVGATVLFGLVQFWMLTGPQAPLALLPARFSLMEREIVLINRDNPYCPPPRQEDWKAESVLAAIRREPVEQRVTRIRALFEVPQITDPIRYLEFWRSLQARFSLAPSAITIDYGLEHQGLLEKTDFVLVKEGGSLGPAFRRRQIEAFLEVFRQRKEPFDLSQTFSLPDHSRLLLYRKQTDP